MRADADREVLGLNDLVKCLEDSKTRKEVDDSEWVMHVCSMFFALEGELSALQSQAGLEQCRLLMRAVRHFKNMLAAQHPSLERLYALCAERPLLSVPVKLFSELYFDPIAFAPDADNNNNNDNDNDLLDRGSGPISVLYAKAQTIAATAFDSHHHQNEQQQQQQQQQPPPLPPRPPKKKAQQQQQPVKRDPKLLISFEKATPENWVSAIIGNGDGRALDIEGACVNDSALEALFTAVEQRLVTVPCLVLDSCIINGDGVRRIVEFCRKNYSMCPVFLQKCTTSPAVEKLLLSEVVAGLSVEKMSYNAAVI